MSSRLTTTEYRALAKKKGRKRNKFNAKADFRCETCGSSAIYGGVCKSCGADAIRQFDSKAEAARWDQLRLRQKAGDLSALRCQVPFPIEIAGKVIGTYLADFTYRDATGALVVEDVKGGKATDTPLSRFKRRAVEAAHGIKVSVVRR